MRSKGWRWPEALWAVAPQAMSACLCGVLPKWPSREHCEEVTPEPVVPTPITLQALACLLWSEGSQAGFRWLLRSLLTWDCLWTGYLHGYTEFAFSLQEHTISPMKLEQRRCDSIPCAFLHLCGPAQSARPRGCRVRSQLVSLMLHLHPFFVVPACAGPSQLQKQLLSAQRLWELFHKQLICLPRGAGNVGGRAGTTMALFSLCLWVPRDPAYHLNLLYLYVDVLHHIAFLYVLVNFKPCFVLKLFNLILWICRCKLNFQMYYP